MTSKARMYLFSVVAIFSAAALSGQDLPSDPVESAGPGQQFIEYLVNGVGVMVLVQALRIFGLVEKIPAFARPLLASGVGALAVYASTWAGFNVDLSALEAVLGGAMMGGAGTQLFGVLKGLGVFSPKPTAPGVAAHLAKTLSSGS